MSLSNYMNIDILKALQCWGIIEKRGIEGDASSKSSFSSPKLAYDPFC